MCHRHRSLRWYRASPDASLYKAKTGWNISSTASSVWRVQGFGAAMLRVELALGMTKHRTCCTHARSRVVTQKVRTVGRQSATHVHMADYAWIFANIAEESYMAQTLEDAARRMAGWELRRTK